MALGKPAQKLNYAVNYYSTHRATVNSKGHLHGIGDSPAEVYNDGKKVWYKDGLKHRDAGKPAVENADGSVEYWVNGTKIDKKAQYSKLKELIALRDQMNTKIREYADQHDLVLSGHDLPAAAEDDDQEYSWRSSNC
jgi:hypothetical protein